MKVPFGGHSFGCDDPKGGAGQVVVRPEGYVAISVPAVERSTRFQFDSPMRKAIFFLLREGIGITYRKVRVSKRQRILENQREVVVAYGRTDRDGRPVVAVGPQPWPKSDRLVFPAELVVEAENESALPTRMHDVARAIDERGHLGLALFRYSPFSGIPLPPEIREILVSKVSGESATCSSFTTEPTPPSCEVVPSLGRGSVAGRRPMDLFLIGAGAYSQVYVLPSITRVQRHTVVDLNPALAANIKREWGFQHASIEASVALRRLKDCERPLVVIATFHSTHVDLAEEALSINPSARIFIEKPPVTTIAQLQCLEKLREEGKGFVEIGYNRRHASMVRRLKEELGRKSGPMTITCLIKELRLPETHWYYWPTQGTRVCGNLSHWIDLGVYLVDELPVSIRCVSASPKEPGDEVSVSVLFRDRSLLTLVASDRGNPLRGVQEYIEVRRGDLTASIDDFQVLRIRDGGRERVVRKLLRDKGHMLMYRDFMERCRMGRTPSYPTRDLVTSSLLYLNIADLLRSGQPGVDIQDSYLSGGWREMRDPINTASTTT